MVSYIILTYLLSIISGLFYILFVRNRISALFTKWFLLGIISFTLLLPLAVDNLLVEQPICLHPSQTVPIAQAVYYNYCPNEAEMQVCLDYVESSAMPFCDCEDFSTNNVLIYKVHSGYDFLLTHEAHFLKVIFISAGIILLILAFKVMHLVYLVWTSRQGAYYLNGKKYILLYPPYAMNVCSFQLWGTYIVWQQEMDTLSEQEQQAILWHEIAHLEQKDTWIKMTLHVVQTIWWSNPIYYFFLKELTRLSEFIADDFAVQG